MESNDNKKNFKSLRHINFVEKKIKPSTKTDIFCLKPEKTPKKHLKMTQISQNKAKNTKKTPKKQVFSLLSWTYGQKNRLIAKNSEKNHKSQKVTFSIRKDFEFSRFAQKPQNCQKHDF